MPEKSLKLLHLEEIIAGCLEESHQDRAVEVGYCFQLFERAIDQGDQDAWAALQHQYKALLYDWLRTTSEDALGPEEVEDLAQETLTKFWRTLSSRAVPIADHFDHVGALLKYLQRCATTTFLDFQRRSQRRLRVRQELTGKVAEQRLVHPQENAVERLHQAERLQVVLRWIDDQVTDELERLVLELTYAQEMSPRQIVACYPNQFPSVQDVRRVKERVLKRARRALLK